MFGVIRLYNLDYKTIKMKDPIESLEPTLNEECKSKPRFIERLEDAVLKFVPILGAFLGARF